MTLRNLADGLAEQSTLVSLHDLIEALKTPTGALLVGNARDKFRDGFASTDVAQPDADIWNVTNDQPTEHIINQGGDSSGASYLRISLSPFVDRTTVTLTSKNKFRLPTKVGWGISMSQRIVGQEVFFGLVEADDADTTMGGIRRNPQPPDQALSATISITTNVGTITVPNHGLKGGDRVNLIDNADRRLNVGPVAITVVDKNTFTVPITLANGTYTANGSVRLVDALSRGNNAVGYLAETSSATALSGVSRRNGSRFRTRTLASASTTATQGNTSPYTDAFLSTGNFENLINMDEVDFRWWSSDSNGGSGHDKFTQGIPDEELDYRLHVRVRSLEGLSRPVAQVVSISKAGSTTATVVTDRPHGLAVNDRVGVVGIRTIASFPHTTDVAVASVPDATTFTAVIGTSATVSDTAGGVVFFNEGNVLSPGAMGFSIQSISRTNNVLVVTLNATASGFLPGEYMNLWGLTGGGEAYEAAYKVVRQTGSTVEFEAPGPDFGVITTGGVIIKRTDVRLHFVRVLDHTRLLTEITGGRGNSSDANNAVPVAITASTTLTPNNAPLLVETTESTTSLGVSATYTGATRDHGSDLTRKPSRSRIAIRHLAGLVPGTLYLEQSTDNTTFYETWRCPIPSDGYVHTFEVPLVSRYSRYRFVNGATAQTSFWFQTLKSMGEGAVESGAKVLLFPLSVTPLAGAASFTSATLDLGYNHNWDEIRAQAFADQAGTVFVDQSRDGTTFRTEGAGQAVGANSVATITQKINQRYVRVRYVNGATIQTAFALDATLATR